MCTSAIYEHGSIALWVCICLKLKSTYLWVNTCIDIYIWVIVGMFICAYMNHIECICIECIDMYPYSYFSSYKFVLTCVCMHIHVHACTLMKGIFSFLEIEGQDQRSLLFILLILIMPLQFVHVCTWIISFDSHDGLGRLIGQGLSSPFCRLRN